MDNISTMNYNNIFVDTVERECTVISRRGWLRFLAILIAYGGFLPAHAQSGIRPRGDVNCDWEVTIADVNVLIASILKGTEYHSFYTYDLDINSDKEITIADINLVIDAILGGKTLAPMPSYSGTLPVLYINTVGYRDIVSKENYLQATWWLDAMGVEGCEPIGSAREPLGLQVKGHGNYTWTDVSKKSLRLKLDAKQRMLGMPSNRHWVLLACADNWPVGLVSNALPFEIGNQMGMPWNPKMEPVEVVLNGEYMGLYLLTEKIRVGKDRVNIVEQANYETNPEKITGGWLMEIENYQQDAYIFFTEGNGKPFWVTTHSPEALSPAQKDYITDFLVQTDSAIYTADKNSREWEQYIDIDSLALYYVVQEIVDNLEAFSGSCYIHKQRGSDTKLIFGPLWDCDKTFFRYCCGNFENKFIYEDVPDNWHSRWISEIAKFPRFQQRVRVYWQQFYNTVYTSMDGYLDDFVSRIVAAGISDYARWPENKFNTLAGRWEYYGKRFYHKRVDWLNDQWGTPLHHDDNPNSIEK